jgi:hypothetical protein
MFVGLEKISLKYLKKSYTGPMIFIYLKKPYFHIFDFQ